MTAAAAGRVARCYTVARRHPWVLGKVADWRIPLGPYTPAQIALAVGGGFLLIKTILVWSWMGPVPLAGWVLAIWAVRRPKIKGRAPVQAAWGWVLLGWQPAGGRIGGRPARDRAPRMLRGGFTIEDTPTPAPAPAPVRAVARVPRPAGPPAPRMGRGPDADAPRPAAPTEEGLGPVSGVQQLRAWAERGGAG
ncbi:hypothetical protein [Streptomyces collinus]|uniref:hypothetical protein n=1 Tax=Streptomyces collinus TaxID=42684 RepID=UPI00363A9D6C